MTDRQALGGPPASHDTRISLIEFASDPHFIVTGQDWSPQSSEQSPQTEIKVRIEPGRAISTEESALAPGKC